MRRTMHALENIENMALLVEVWKSHLKMLQKACQKNTCHPGPIQAPRASPKIDRLTRSRSRAPTVGPQGPVGAVGPRPADDGRAPTVGSGQSGPDRPTTVGPRLWGQGSRAPTGQRRSVPNCQGPVGDDGRAPTVRARSGQSGPDRPMTGPDCQGLVRSRRRSVPGPGRGSRAPTGRRRSGPDCQGPVGARLSGPGRGSRAPTGRRQSGPDSTAAALVRRP